MIKSNKCILAFTLAEVLITLGIIGIVAEMTIPTLINNFQKQETAVMVEKTYSDLSQAIRLSEIDNGPVATWNFDDKGDALAGSHTFF
jgi:type II secretory pathway pseudopilin PulG